MRDIVLVALLTGLWACGKSHDHDGTGEVSKPKEAGCSYRGVIMADPLNGTGTAPTAQTYGEMCANRTTKAECDDWNHQGRRKLSAQWKDGGCPDNWMASCESPGGHVNYLYEGPTTLAVGGKDKQKDIYAEACRADGSTATVR